MVLKKTEHLPFLVVIEASRGWYQLLYDEVTKPPASLDGPYKSLREILDTLPSPAVVELDLIARSGENLKYILID